MTCSSDNDAKRFEIEVEISKTRDLGFLVQQKPGKDPCRINCPIRGKLEGFIVVEANKGASCVER